MNETLKKTEENVEKAVRKAEDEVEKVVRKAEAAEKNILKNRWVRAGGAVAAVLIVCGGLLYWQSSSTRVKIEKSLISAPLIGLSPTASGQIQETYVNEGDTVAANQPVAKVGDEVIKTKIAGEIISVQKDIGKTVNAGQSVVSMINPDELHAVGTIEENKGLDKIAVGQPVEFTVDAYGSRQYVGVVDAVSPTAHSGDVVFNISDNRPTQQFDIKVRFNHKKYPELKNGMSAKITVFVK